MNPGTELSRALDLIESAPLWDNTSDDHEASSDWRDTEYKCEFEAVSGDSCSWTAKHELTGAPGVQSLLASGEAEWAVEIRCASALHVAVSTSASREHVVRVDPAVVGTYSDIRLWPGVIVTAERCLLDATDTAWNTQIPVGRGRWLVRDAPFKPTQGQRSMLQFIGRDAVPEGQVEITLEEHDGDYFFKIFANSDRIAQIQSGDALIGCWATALAMLPLHDCFDIEETDGQWKVPGSQNAEAVMRELEEKAIQLWGPGEQQKRDWDPMAAATAFLPLNLQPTTGTDDYDE